MKKVLFICTGNYFRSKFAEIYFNFKKANTDWIAFSRGFDISNVKNTGPISFYSINKLNELDIVIPEQINMPELLTEQDLLQSEIIIALNELEHRTFIKKQFPLWENKIVFWSIKDLYEEDAKISLNKLILEIEKIISHNRFV